MKAKHVFIAIVISWLVVLVPYVIPALNVSTRFLGVPVTVWVAIIGIAIPLVVNEIAYHKTWELFDVEQSGDKEVE